MSDPNLKNEVSLNRAQSKKNASPNKLIRNERSIKF